MWAADRFMLTGLSVDVDARAADGDRRVALVLGTSFPESVFMMFQMTFSTITPALIVGAFVDRMKFAPMLVFMILWSIMVYAPIAHWVWSPNGFLFGDGVLDFAGGTVVHINARHCRPRLLPRARQAHRLRQRADGAAQPRPDPDRHRRCCGSAGSASTPARSSRPTAVRAWRCRVTHIAAASAAVAWMLVEWVAKGKPSLLGDRLGRRGRSGRDHPGRRLRAAERRAGHRPCGRHRLLLRAPLRSRTRWAMTTRWTCSASTASAASWARCSPASSPPRPSAAMRRAACSTAIPASSGSRSRASSGRSAGVASPRFVLLKLVDLVIGLRVDATASARAWTRPPRREVA